MEGSVEANLLFGAIALICARYEAVRTYITGLTVTAETQIKQKSMSRLILQLTSINSSIFDAFSTRQRNVQRDSQNDIKETRKLRPLLETRRKMYDK